MLTAGRAVTQVMRKALGLTLLISVSVLNSASSVEIQVAITGDDAQDGISAPVRSLERAIILARTVKKPCTILLQSGTWNDVSVQLGPEDSGLTITAAHGAQPRLLGGHPISGWVADGDGLVAAKVPGVRGRAQDFRTLLIDGQPAPRARLPASGWFTHESTFDVPWNSTAGGGFRGADTPERRSSLVYRAGDVGGWLSIADAELTIVHSWDDSQVGLAGHDEATRTLRFLQPATYPAGAFGIQRWCVSNIRQGLTQPGQWYLDHERELVVYRLRPGENLSQHEVLIPTRDTVIAVIGTEEQSVRCVRISGIDIVVSNIPLGSGGWAAAGFPSAVNLWWTESCEISNLTIVGVGGHGISSRAGRGNVIRSCVISDSGGGGIYAVNGISESISENRITRPGRAANAAIALRVIGTGQVSKKSHDNLVFGNSISDCPYAGIEFEGTNNRYENNLIDRAMQVLEDGAGIYGGGTHHIIRGNTVRNITSKGGSGIYIDELGRDNLVEGNRILDCPWPLHMNDCGPNQIRGNLLASHGGMRLTFSGNSHGFAAENNVIYSGGGIRLLNAAAVTSWNNTLAWSAIGDYGFLVGGYQVLPEAIRRADPGVDDSSWRLRRGQPGALLLGDLATAAWLTAPDPDPVEAPAKPTTAPVAPASTGDAAANNQATPPTHQKPAEPIIVVVPAKGSTPVQSMDAWVDLGGKRNDAADLSATFTIERDAESVAVSITVHDDHHSQDEHGLDTWKGDSLQFALQSLPAEDPTQASSYALALTSSGTELAYHAVQDLLNSQPMEATQVTITRINAQTLVYRIVIPFSQLGHNTTHEFGLSLLVNDNDGHGRKGYLQWGGDGIGQGLKPQQFGRIRLEP